MEQAPIHETATGFAPPGDKRVAARLETDHGERGTKISQLGDILAIQPPCPGLSCVAQARAADPRLTGFPPFDEDLNGLGLRTHQTVPHASTETAPVRHQVQRFEQAGLAGTVIARDQIEPGFRRQ